MGSRTSLRELSRTLAAIQPAPPTSDFLNAVYTRFEGLRLARTNGRFRSTIRLVDGFLHEPRLSHPMILPLTTMFRILGCCECCIRRPTSFLGETIREDLVGPSVIEVDPRVANVFFPRGSGVSSRRKTGK